MDARVGHRGLRGIGNHRGFAPLRVVLRDHLLRGLQVIEPSALRTPGAWRALRAQVRPFVAKRVPASDIDDVVQEVFLRVQRGLPKLRDEQRLGPWIYQVARNAVADHGRAAARKPGADELERIEQTAWTEPPDDGAAGRAAAQYAALFVSMLPDPYREALTLTELEGLTQKEAAAQLGLSLSGMKSRVQRGRAKLRASLEACCDFALDARHRVIAVEPRPDGKLPDGCCST